MNNQEVNSKLFLFLVAVVTLLSIVTMVLSGIAYTRSSSPTVTVTSPAGGYSGGSSSGSDSGGVILVNGGNGQTAPVSNPGGVVWNIAIGHDYGAHEYLDDAGYLQGFGIDMITAVCEAANINCNIIWDVYSNCWDSSAGQHAKGGQGLHDRWYDACTGWYTTTDRIKVFSFSQPYLKFQPANFFVKAGGSFNYNDLNGKTIGFMDGWASDEKCVARQSSISNNILPANKIKYYVTSQELRDAIVSGAVDAGFTTHSTLEPYLPQTTGSDGSLNVAGQDDFSCMIAGNSMMTRKDSGFAMEWNRGFQKIRSNGKFREICQNAATLHNAAGSIDCVDT